MADRMKTLLGLILGPLLLAGQTPTPLPEPVPWFSRLPAAGSGWGSRPRQSPFERPMLPARLLRLHRSREKPEGRLGAEGQGPGARALLAAHADRDAQRPSLDRRIGVEGDDPQGSLD